MTSSSTISPATTTTTIPAITVAGGYPLDLTCGAPGSAYPFCGVGAMNPGLCYKIKSTAPPCIVASKAKDYSSLVAAVPCKTCTQSTAAKCTAEALKVFVGGVKAAYCNDQWLVIMSDGAPTWSTNLFEIPNPPGSTQIANGTFANGTQWAGTNYFIGDKCVTRYTNPSWFTYAIPLSYTLLPTASSLNNINSLAYPGGAGDTGYLSGMANGASVTYGLPTRGAIGTTISGQEIYPVFNNRAGYTPEFCEVDSCNEHVGGGGGEPHLHGDPFGSFCLYSGANYSNAFVHPPVIGFSFDGPTIYGRHINVNNLGFTVPLDECGGHAHGNLDYHYHTQVVNTVTDSMAQPAIGSGVAYALFPPGPFKCWRVNISAIPNFWTKAVTDKQPCCGMNTYFAATGISITTSPRTG